jgi:MFS transporter, Spinster family, sphingosine-1-phosphate transporter
MRRRRGVLRRPHMKAETYRVYMLVLLLVITAHNFVDRTALGLVLQDIKTDLHLSDTQLGVLTGIAFALFYALMGIPIARWADRGNRVTIITLTTVLWSAAVVLSGTARTFVELLIIRVGVAVGEAGCFPASHSLIAEYFTRGERPRAVAIYLLGGPLGILLGYLPAGWLNESFGWRVTFEVLGVPGLALGALAWLTLREPRVGTSPHARTGDEPLRIKVEASVVPTVPSPTLVKIFAVLWSNRTFRNLLLSMSVAGFFAYGILQWLPAFFIRSYAMETGQVGTWFALINGLGGLAGTYLGGVLAERYARYKEKLQLRAIACAYVAFVGLSAGVYLSPTRYLAFTFLGLAMFGVCTMNGPIFAIIQLVVADRIRATAIALVYLLANLVGMGLGPLVAGMLSDLFNPWAGDQSLRYALLILSPGYLGAAWFVWKAAQTVGPDIQSAQARDQGAIPGGLAVSAF